jgi:hypothetical protein
MFYLSDHNHSGRIIDNAYMGPYGGFSRDRNALQIDFRFCQQRTAYSNGRGWVVVELNKFHLYCESIKT